MRNQHSRMRALIVAGLLAVLAVRVVPAANASSAAPAPASVTSAAVPAAQANAIIGQGFWAKLGCIGCTAAILAAGGTTIVGLAIIAGTMPEVVAGCALGCVVAFS